MPDPGRAAATTPVLHFIPQCDGQVQVVYRQAGDKNLLVEYGPLELDLNLRFRAHALMDWLAEQSGQAVGAGNAAGTGAGS